MSIALANTAETQRFLAALHQVAAGAPIDGPAIGGDCDDDAAEWEAAVACAAELARWPAATLRRALAIVDASGESSTIR